jgi:hypothetical protein
MAEFDYESPVPEDKAEENAELTAKVQAFAILVGAGVHPDAAADVVGLPQMMMKTPEALPAIEEPSAPLSTKNIYSNGYQNGQRMRVRV